jgi:hypothetical protein
MDVSIENCELFGNYLSAERGVYTKILEDLPVLLGTKRYGNWIELPVSLSLSLDARGHSTTKKNGKFFGLLGGSRNLAAPNGIHNGIRNPSLG